LRVVFPGINRQISARLLRAARIINSPAITSVSLLARQTRFPLRGARKVGTKPIMRQPSPETILHRLAGCVATSTSPASNHQSVLKLETRAPRNLKHETFGAIFGSTDEFGLKTRGFVRRVFSTFLPAPSLDNARSRVSL